MKYALWYETDNTLVIGDESKFEPDRVIERSSSIKELVYAANNIVDKHKTEYKQDSSLDIRVYETRPELDLKPLPFTKTQKEIYELLDDHQMWLESLYEDSENKGKQGKQLDLQMHDLRGLDFSGRAISLGKFMGSDISDCDFSWSTIEKTDLSRTTFDRTDFSNSTIQRCDLRLSSGEDTNFENAMIELSHTAESHFIGNNFNNAFIAQAVVSESVLDDSTFVNTYINPDPRNWLNCSLKNVDLKQLRQTSLSIDKDVTPKEIDILKHDAAIAIARDNTLYKIYNERIIPKTAEEVIKMLEEMPSAEEIAKRTVSVTKLMYRDNSNRTEETQIEFLKKVTKFANQKADETVRMINEYTIFNADKNYINDEEFTFADMPFDEHMRENTIHLAAVGIKKSYKAENVFDQIMPIHIGTTDLDELGNRKILRVQDSEDKIDIKGTNLEIGESALIFGDARDYEDGMDSLAVYPIEQEHIRTLTEELGDYGYTEINLMQRKPDLMDFIRKYADTRTCENLLKKVELETVKVINGNPYSEVGKFGKTEIVNKDQKVELNEGDKIVTRHKTTPIELWEHTHGRAETVVEQLLQKKKEQEASKQLKDQDRGR